MKRIIALSAAALVIAICSASHSAEVGRMIELLHIIELGGGPARFIATFGMPTEMMRGSLEDLDTEDYRWRIEVDGEPAMLTLFALDGEIVLCAIDTDAPPDLALRAAEDLYGEPTEVSERGRCAWLGGDAFIATIPTERGTAIARGRADILRALDGYGR